MKNFAIAALLTLISISMNAQVIYGDDRNDLRYDNKENVKYHKHLADNHITDVKVYGYSHKYPNGILSYEVKYDSRGNIIENIEFNKHGRTESDYKFQYDDSNRNTYSIELNKKANPISGGFWTYDKSGNIIQQRIWWKDTSKIVLNCLIAYDSKNNPTQAKIYNSKKKLYSTTDYEYYDDGSKKKTTSYDRKGKVVGVWNYDCNPIGKLQESKMKDTSKICVHYETDKNGNPIKVKEEYTQGGWLFPHRLRNISKYDKDNHCIELITMKMDGKETEHSSSDFDAQGNRTEWRMYVPNSTLVKKREVFTYNNAGDIVASTFYSKSSEKGLVRKYVYN